MLLLILVIIAIALIFYFLMVKPFDYWKDRGVKQGNPKWIFGDLWGTVSRTQSFAEMLQMVYNQCPGTRYSGIYHFTSPSLLIKDPDLLKQITVKDFDHFTDRRSLIPENSDPLWSRNLFSLKGQQWRDMRAILSPSFTSSKMKTMFVLISECAENFIQFFRNKNEDVVTVEFKDIFTRFTNDVIATTAFGIKIDSLSDPSNDFYLMGTRVTDVSGFWKNIKFFMFFLFPKICNILKLNVFSPNDSNFFKKIVKRTIKVREEKGIVRPDMINLLLQARKGIQQNDDTNVIGAGFSTDALENELDKSKLPTTISDTDIAAQAMIFFLAGYDTVSGFMCLLAYELAVNPDVQNRLREEIRATLQERGGKLTYEALLTMKYMAMVFSETLRKWPNIIGVDRVCTKPYTIKPVKSDEKPLRLETRMIISIPIYAIHHDPNHFPNPERFDPERFSDENKERVKPYTYLPFGLGQRNCIGSRFALMETKTVMFYILDSFELVPVEKSRVPLRISKKSVVLGAEDGFWFGLKYIKA